MDQGLGFGNGMVAGAEGSGVLPMPSGYTGQSEEGPVPPELQYQETVMALGLHPTMPIVASGLVDGIVSVVRYDPTGGVANQELASLIGHAGRPVRTVDFSEDGAVLFTGDAAGAMAIVDVGTGGVIRLEPAAHDTGLTAMKEIGSGLIATGDDNGVVKVWDPRASRAVFKWEEHEDYISDLAMHPKKPMLVAVSGDGMLSVCHTRKGRLEAMSDFQDDELLSCVILKEGKKVVTGSMEGDLRIWDWGDFGDMQERFPGHPQSVETLALIDEDTIATGSSDGLIRVVSIQPNKLLGVIGEHEEFPIERIAITKDKNFLVSCSHDCTVKFWNISWLYEEDEDDDEDEEGTKAMQTLEAHMAGAGVSSDSFEGVSSDEGERNGSDESYSDDSGDSDDDDDDDDEEGRQDGQRVVVGSGSSRREVKTTGAAAAAGFIMPKASSLKSRGTHMGASSKARKRAKQKGKGKGGMSGRQFFADM